MGTKLLIEDPPIELDIEEVFELYFPEESEKMLREILSSMDEDKGVE